jgi:hypothetical protein
MASEEPGTVEVLSQRPRKDDHRLSLATQCLYAFRNHIIERHRASALMLMHPRASACRRQSRSSRHRLAYRGNAPLSLPRLQHAFSNRLGSPPYLQNASANGGTSLSSNGFLYPRRKSIERDDSSE